MKSGRLVTWAFLIMTVGCQGYQGTEIRRDHVQTYPQNLASNSRMILDEYADGLTLQDCIHLALKHGLAARSAELQQRIARMDRNISFSNFLPTVSLEFQKLWWDPNPMIGFGESAVALHDKDVRDITWNIHMSIVNPATWFLHGMVNRGYEITSLANDYIRQQIVFQTTGLFYQCLSLEQMQEVTENQLTAAEAHAKEFSALQKEGLMPFWQVENAMARVLRKTAEVHQMERAVRESRAAFNIAMGLAPEMPIMLKMHTQMTEPKGTLEELITEALLNHPQLAIADRKIAIEKEKVKLAVSNFLPFLTGIASHIDTSDSRQVYSTYWMGGLIGSISLFNGFSDINRYRAARLRQEAMFIQREQETLALMVQVIRAYDQIGTSREMMSVASAMEKVAQVRRKETQDRFDQGFIRSGELLTVTAQADEARVQSLLARFRHQISIAAMRNVLGRMETPCEDSQNE